MVQSMLIKFLTSSLAQSIIKKVVLAALEHLVQKSDNKLDDKLLAAVKEALGE